MRGRLGSQGEVYHFFHLDDLIPAGHPLRSIKVRADGILRGMSRRFSGAYGQVGRPSIPPERLIKALLLQALYSIRSEIQLCEHIGYNLLYRWFLDMNPSDKVWTPEVFSMNRQRFADHGLVRDFFDRVVKEAILEGLVSGEHFSVDGTLIQSLASMKSVRPIDSTDGRVSDSSEGDDRGNPTVNFRGEKRTNATHRSIVDPEARLMRKGDGKPAMLSHSVHVLMENRSGLCLNVAVAESNGTSERTQAVQMLDSVRKRHRLWPRTMAMDAGYRDGTFLSILEACHIVPHAPTGSGPILGDHDAAQARRRARRREKTREYRCSQRVRKRVEEIIGWCKTIGGLARARFVGRWRIELQGEVTAAAYNLLRLARLAPAA